MRWIKAGLLGGIAMFGIGALVPADGEAQMPPCWACTSENECLNVPEGYDDCDDSIFGLCELSGDGTCSERTLNDLELKADGTVRVANAQEMETIQQHRGQGVFTVTRCGAYIVEREYVAAEREELLEDTRSLEFVAAE